MKKTYAIYNSVCLFISLICFISMFVFGSTVHKTVGNALKICAFAIIPSLFPFIVCSRLLVNFYIRAKAKNIKSNFSIMPSFSYSAVVYLLGLTSGFPVGALLAGKMYESGALTKNDAEKCAVYCSVASPSFCISYLGGQILGSRLYGLIIFLSVAVISFLLMLLDNFIFGNKESERTASFSKTINNKTSTVTEIIGESGITILNICAFVTFFMCISEIILKLLCFLNPAFYAAKPIVTGFLEISAGISALENVNFGRKILLGAVITGFGGISALMQVMSVYVKYDFSPLRLIVFKIFSAIFVPFTVFVFFFAADFISNTEFKAVPLTLLITAVASILIFIIKKSKKYIGKAKIISKI